MIVDQEMIEYAKEVVKIFGAGKMLETREIVRAIHLKYGRTEGSIIPSDYCYNLVNNGIQPSKPTLFKYKGRSQ